MPAPPSADMLRIVAALFAGAVLGCVFVWTTLFRRLTQGEAVLPCERRRPVPWRGSDVLLIFLIYSFPSLVGLGELWLAKPKLERPPAAVEMVVERADAEKPEVAHPVIELLQKHPSVSSWLLCLLSAVVMAPIVEETLFRLVFQGWLESLETRWRVLRLWPRIRGFWPVGIASVLFASLHFRTAKTPMPVEDVQALLAWLATWNLITLAMIGTVLFARRRATWSDLGIVPDKFWSDVRLGLVAFVAVAAPLYALQLGLQMHLKDVAADPITLTVFAAVLGFLYFRTHRLVPSIVLHLALNATSLLLAGLLSGS